MNRRLFGLMRKELIQFFRDTSLIILVLYMFFETAQCGWALTLDVRNIPTAIYDADRSAESRELIDAFARLEDFTLVARVDDPAFLDEFMEEGKVQLAIIIPASFSSDINGGQAAGVQLLFDGSNSAIASQAMIDASGLLQAHNARIARTKMSRSGQVGHSFLPMVNNKVRIWYNPELKFDTFTMLTMVNISVLVLGILLPAASIVREKESGTLEQLMVTPITGFELIVAKTLPMIPLKMVGLTVGIAMSLWLFDVPLRGNLLLFYAISFIMLLSSMGIGVLIGTIAQNMQQTLMICFFLIFPMAFLSGTMVPIINMSTFMQWISFLSPLRYYVEATFGIFLKGVGLDILWPQALALIIYGVVLLTVSAFRLRGSLT